MVAHTTWFLSESKQTLIHSLRLAIDGHPKLEGEGKEKQWNEYY